MTKKYELDKGITIGDFFVRALMPTKLDRARNAYLDAFWSKWKPSIAAMKDKEIAKAWKAYRRELKKL